MDLRQSVRYKSSMNHFRYNPVSVIQTHYPVYIHVIRQGHYVLQHRSSLPEPTEGTGLQESKSSVLSY